MSTGTSEQVIDALRIVYADVSAGSPAARRSRRAVAARALQPGDVVVRAPAAASRLHEDQAGRRCDMCFAVAGAVALSRCSRCRTVHYCGRACQEAAWRAHHRAECGVPRDALVKALAAQGVAGAGALSDALLAARCLRTASSAPSGIEASSGTAKELEPLDNGEIGRLGQIASAVASVPKLLPPSAGEEDVLGILARFGNNNFAIVDDLFLSVGAGVFPLGASLNHSCSPNCLLTYIFEEGKAPMQVVRAMVDIREGDELAHSYVELAFPAWQRKEQLRANYGFDCECKLCTGGDAARAEIDALLVSSADGRGAIAALGERCPLPLAPPCAERDGDLVEAERLAAAAAAEEDAEKELKLAERVCDIRERWLHRRHIEVTAAHAAAHTAAVAAGDWPAAERHCGRLVEQYLLVYPPWHPVTGLQMYTLAELKEQLGASNEALQWYERARDVLRLTHGVSHPMVEDLNLRVGQTSPA